MTFKNLAAECYFCGSTDIHLIPYRNESILNRLASSMEITGKPRCGLCGSGLIIWNQVGMIIDVSDLGPPDEDEEDDGVGHDQHR
jgi:hypothetical protein